MGRRRMRMLGKIKAKAKAAGIDGSSSDEEGEGGAKKRNPDYSQDVDAAHEKINVEQLAKKEELFQIRFIVHKARKLAGAIQSPLVRIHLDTKVLRTKPRKGKTPKFNETLLFSLTKSEVELVECPVEIRIIDSSKSVQYSLIGLYKCDLSIAWVAKDKNLFYKWFALSNPDEPQDGLTGYINVSIQIIPPGESAKEAPKMRDEEIDRSDNVFFPPGIALQPGRFIVKVFNGEDMPQMDSDVLPGIKKLLTNEQAPTDEEGNTMKPQLVDPYTKVEFAGISVEGSVQYETSDPVWNEQITIDGDFPSMAEHIVIKLYDNDDYAIDDLIATKLVHMDEISYPSSDAVLGFSPSFGPAYVPFYGSFREFSDVYDSFNFLNYGVGEAVAYRGRVLLEISTKMGGRAENEKQVAPLHPSEPNNVMKHLSRHKYHLFASFVQGNMIMEKENQVEFEVSIGDYGNKFSPSANPAPSTTQPCNAVFDGSKYFFMPWGRTKPTVILHSQWEDMRYRAEALNTLIWMRDFMGEKINQYEILMKAFAREYELQDKMDNVLQELYNALVNLPMEPPDGEVATELDHKRYAVRKFTLNNMIDEIKNMMEGRLKSMSRQDKYKRLLSVKERMDELCFEPQLGVPDVFIWMICGTKRVAYHRIPSNEILYSKSKFGRGKHCGKTESFFLKVPLSEVIGAHVTMSLWFGKFEHLQDDFKPPRGSEVIVYAETYENQMSVLGSWTTKLLPRPVFSDTTGKFNLPLEKFQAPAGWEFSGEWFISIDRSLTFDAESGLKEFTEEVYEGETRLPGSPWGGKLVSRWWSDNKGDDCPSKDSIELTDGWEWMGDWEIDTNRAVDDQGYEYALDANIANYGPVQRSYHLSRRRRWIRRRERNSDLHMMKKKDIDPDGWEYSKIFTTKFHPRERKFDMVRRRRYNRRLVSNVPKPVVFKIVEEEAKGDKPAKIVNMAPRIITEYDDRQVHKYQLRAYLYQARGLLGADPSGYSDPYARVIFGNRSATTDVIFESISPNWDTTLVLDAVEICGHPDDIAASPPYIVIEIFDEDVLNHDQLGRVVCKPAVFNGGKYKPTKLQWFPVGGVRRAKGDILAAFEMFRMGAMEMPHLPRFEKMHYLVPQEVRPKLQLTRVEVLTWGVRLMKDYHMIPVDSPNIDIDIGGDTLRIEKIESLKKHPNFGQPYQYVDVWLPIDEEFLPPINIRVMDNRTFGYQPLVAVATIKEYGQYRTTYHRQELDTEGVSDANVLKELMADDFTADDEVATPEEGGSAHEGLTPVGEEGHDPAAAPEAEGSVELQKGEEVVIDVEVADKAQGGSHDEVVVEIEEPVRSDSKAQLISTTTTSTAYNDDVLVNPLVSESSTISDTEMSAADLLDSVAMEMEKESSVTDIKITIPQTAIDASKDPNVKPVKDKQLEKDLKKQEKIYKKEAKKMAKMKKREKREHAKRMKKLEKERKREQKSQEKARYKADQERKKRMLEAAELESEEEEDEGELYIPEELDTRPISPTPEIDPDNVPNKAAGLLGMWYGASNETEATNATRLSRKETRKLKQQEEGDVPPHPDDILVSDFWSKYYQAIGKDARLDKIFKERNLPELTHFDEELEKSYNNFRDLMEVIHLQRPDNEISTEDDPEDLEPEDHHVGIFKGSFKIYPITEADQNQEEEPVLMFSNLPSNASQDVLVRIYVIAAVNLTPLDYGGTVDPFLWCHVGKHKFDESSNYQTKKINPEFGKMFEARCALPRDSQCIIKVYDHDLIGSNDLIGQTKIDLEDRFLSWKRASCGLAKQYIVDKDDKDVWRDHLKPIAILKRVCVLRGWPQPVFKGKGSTLRCYVNNSEYKLKYFESSKGEKDSKLGSDEHRLSLYVLHELGAVPEHFESRTLYNDDCPGIPQGKLHLWVDIFPYDRNLPPPIDIRPRQTEPFVLRLIVWDTHDVILADENIMGEKMSDIFVKIYMEGLDKYSQETDVHFRSLTGEGNFNWRMCYDFDYLKPEQKVVSFQRKNFFSLDKVEEKLEPILHMQVYDYDTFSSNDLIGWCELSLVSLPPPTKTSKECKLDIFDTPQKDRISIFDKKKIRGFWPVFDDSMGEQELTGKVDLEIEILTGEDAEEKPAGQGRNSPNQYPTLEPPNRPMTSFNFLFNPLKIFKILIWDKLKWKILTGFIILLIVALLALFIYTSPQAINNAIYNSIGK